MANCVPATLLGWLVLGKQMNTEISEENVVKSKEEQGSDQDQQVFDAQVSVISQSMYLCGDVNFC